MQKSLQSTLMIIALLLGAIVFGLFTVSARSQAPATPFAPVSSLPSSGGRYQVSYHGDVESVFDTQTGQIWWHKVIEGARINQDTNWQLEAPLPSPKP